MPFGAHETLEVHEVLTEKINMIQHFSFYARQARHPQVKAIAEHHLQAGVQHYNELVAYTHDYSAARGHAPYGQPPFVSVQDILYGLRHPAPVSPETDGSFNDEQILSAILCCHKNSAKNQMTAALECADPNVRRMLLTAADAAADHAYEVFLFMNSQGQYQVPTLHDHTAKTYLHTFQPVRESDFGQITGNYGQGYGYAQEFGYAPDYGQNHLYGYPGAGGSQPHQQSHQPQGYQPQNHQPGAYGYNGGYNAQPDNGGYSAYGRTETGYGTHSYGSSAYRGQGQQPDAPGFAQPSSYTGGGASGYGSAYGYESAGQQALYQTQSPSYVQASNSTYQGERNYTPQTGSGTQPHSGTQQHSSTQTHSGAQQHQSGYAASAAGTRQASHAQTPVVNSQRGGQEEQTDEPDSGALTSKAGDSSSNPIQ
ncbi:spore coat protein [Paenibacillus chitinolyticus]|uniref:Spore coat protein n=1 Tax=Paenibacillus chitinolyticus TaxID=79263 RepID=A0A410WUC0_9BACL|nr:spore coat protein [Paenibacillus chitinolyticus]MCY9593653.1 spore coat protein [Paenibacillus chitinolyticus]MCY9595089.1 spore coat protein [Paenibacillus chitinolyticus]QAV17953.1 spore coat protein [Paenibacillus chitinolyticus]